MSLFSHNLHPVIKKWHLSSEGINYLVFIQTSQIFKRPLLNITQIFLPVLYVLVLMLIDLNAAEYLFHKIFVYHLAFSYSLSTVYKQKFYQQQLN